MPLGKCMLAATPTGILCCNRLSTLQLRHTARKPLAAPGTDYGPGTHRQPPLGHS